MNKGKAKDARTLIENAMLDIAQDLGMEIKVGSIRYDADSFRCTLSARDVGALSPEQRTYDELQALMDLPPRGTRLNIDGVLFETYGFKPRAPKFPVLIKNLSGDGRGQLHKCTTGYIKAAEVVG